MQLIRAHIMQFASRHTTTALAINENEERLLEDVKVHLRKLAPESGSYLHIAFLVLLRYSLVQAYQF